MKLLKPEALKSGDAIRIVASSSPFEKRHFFKGVAFLKSLGFKIKYEKGIFSKKHYLAGTDARRAHELVKALNDQSAKAVLFARGGYGMMRLLPFLDKAKLTQKPKIVLGYSDITALLGYLHHCLKWVCFYGPVVAKDIHAGASKDTLNSFYTGLTKKEPLDVFKFKDTITVTRGRVTAPITGGCLSLMVSLMGTPYEIDTDNKILFLEDVNEQPYQIDRMLMQLKLGKKFKKCRGLVFGSLAPKNKASHYIDTIKGVVKEYGFPVLFNFPAGHGHKQITLPLGVRACLDTAKQSLTYLESALV